MIGVGIVRRFIPHGAVVVKHVPSANEYVVSRTPAHRPEVVGRLYDHLIPSGSIVVEHETVLADDENQGRTGRNLDCLGECRILVEAGRIMMLLT